MDSTVLLERVQRGGKTELKKRFSKKTFKKLFPSPILVFLLRWVHSQIYYRLSSICDRNAIRFSAPRYRQYIDRVILNGCYGVGGMTIRAKRTHSTLFTNPFRCRFGNEMKHLTVLVPFHCSSSFLQATFLYREQGSAFRCAINRFSIAHFSTNLMNFAKLNNISIVDSGNFLILSFFKNTIKNGRFNLDILVLIRGLTE